MGEIDPDLFAQVPAWVFKLPPVNAVLNTVCTILLCCGWLMIRRDNRRAHIACMTGALAMSVFFLTTYVLYHSILQRYAEGASVPFTHQGIIRPIYFFILLTHIVLAALNVPLVLTTVIPALRKKFRFHKKIARWTLPIWLYVSVTGVLVYLMLYHWFPSEALQYIQR